MCTLALQEVDDQYRMKIKRPSGQRIGYLREAYNHSNFAIIYFYPMIISYKMYIKLMFY